jgi:virginiamycin B lyase
MLSRLILVFGANAAFGVLLAAAVHAQTPGQDFPDGPGKEWVVATCGACHDINRLKAGYTPQGWRTVVQMMQNVGAPVPDGKWADVEDYLVKAFPERPRPAAARVEGPAQTKIRTWSVPTLGSRPHDPLAAKDGAIWWTGQLANKLGRLDPKSGAYLEYTLPTPRSGPHGLVEDKDGSIWFTANSGGYVGRLDPKTGTVEEHPLPDNLRVRDPHTLVFDQSGILWFTVQQGNVIGRLDPASGEMKIIPSKTVGSRPYGIQINSKGVPFTVLFGTNKIASIDPTTLEIREYVLPDAGARPRRLAIDGDDKIWYTDFARGFLGRFDPLTGEVKEWPSPSGPKSEPYGIVFTKGALWYNESFAKPNTIVRFDPKTESFQTWAIPGGGDIVRNMAVAPDGNPVTANSLANEVGLVEVK